MKEHKKEIWRIIVGIISITFIIFMWVKKDIGAIYSTMPREQLVPVIVTSSVVTLIKVLGIAIVVLLFKWIVGKVKNKNIK